MNFLSQHLREQVEFVRWAEHALVVSARSVADRLYCTQQLSKDRTMPTGLLHKSLVHAVAVGWLWLPCCRGESPGQIQDVTAVATHKALEARWPLVHSALANVLGR